ncbi:MAG: hypothetical protein ABSD99_12935, partial [Candidatus Bathyarchaeia archaeon]
LCGAGLLGLGIFGSQLWDAISFWLGIAIQIPYNLVRPFTLLDAKEFVTFIFAEGFFVLNAFIFRWLFFRNRDLRGPRIIIQGGSIYAENSGVRVFCASVSNTGDSAARSCQARITLDDIEQRDMEGLPSVNTTFNLQNFTSSIKTDLRWKKDNHKEMTIRSEDDAELEILRFVPENDGVPAHFDVPSESGWEPLSASLNLSTLYIRIKVVPLNGRPSKYTYWTERHKGEWTLGAFR